MANKKKKKKKDSELIQIQKLANKSQEKIQGMINSANTLTAQFNASEAEKARQFNALESATARQFNADEARLAREFNASEAEKTRSYEKMMSDTSHQREVADLRAAGLNPVLSANGGAASYTGASASAQAASTSALAGASASASFESGASSAASIMGNLLSGISNLFGSRTSAKATKYSADKSSSATRYAADQAAAATRYAADMHYRSIMEAPTSSLVQYMDKHFGKDAVNFIKNDSKRKGLWQTIKDYGYNAALNSHYVTDLMHTMGIYTEGYSKDVTRKVRQHVLSSITPNRKKYEYHIKWLHSFKTHARR